MASFVDLKAGNTAYHDSIELSEFSVVASYNWLDETQPTILVPGIPPVWSPPSDVPALNPDTGTRYIDQNKDRMPDSPFEPLICAIQAHRPDFDFSAVDIITDRRSLKQLYGSISGDTQVFEFGIVVIGNSTVFTRAQPESRETIPPNKFVGYRQSFEEAYTKIHSVARGSTSHHRLVTYKIGGLQFLVRSGTDAYRPSAIGEIRTAPPNSQSGEEEFTRNIKTLSLDKGISSGLSSFTTHELRVRKGGFDVPQAAILELSTHTAARPSIVETKMVDLYFAQTPCFAEATFRSSGPRDDLAAQRARFEDITIQDVTGLSQKWEKDHQDELSELIDLLKQVTTCARTLDSPCILKSMSRGIVRVEEVKDRQIPTFSNRSMRLFLDGHRDETYTRQEQAEDPSKEK